jgi:hypothetical protein
MYGGALLKSARTRKERREEGEEAMAWIEHAIKHISKG